MRPCYCAVTWRSGTDSGITDNTTQWILDTVGSDSGTREWPTGCGKIQKHHSFANILVIIQVAAREDIVAPAGQLC